MTSPRLLAIVGLLAGLLAGLALVVGVGVAGGVGWEGDERREGWTAEAGHRPRPERPAAQALAVLHKWDARRARAWAQADPAALARLYVPGSRTGRRDVAMLQRWRSRGLRVQHLEVQVLAAEVRLQSRDRLVLAVTDRMVGATAVGGGRRAVLPLDHASSHVVALRVAQGEWRVSEVRGQASAERSTARTPASRNS